METSLSVLQVFNVHILIPNCYLPETIYSKLRKSEVCGSTSNWAMVRNSIGNSIYYVIFYISTLWHSCSAFITANFLSAKHISIKMYVQFRLDQSVYCLIISMQGSSKFVFRNYLYLELPVTGKPLVSLSHSVALHCEIPRV
jgi:hypothetical protein